MGIVMNELETFFLNQEVRGLAKAFCELPVAPESKKRAILAGLRMRAAVWLSVTDGDVLSALPSQKW